MSTASAVRPAPVPAAAKHAAKVAAATAGDRPLDPEEYDLARFFVRRWSSARSIIAGLYGSPDPTPEYLAALKRYEEFEGDEAEYEAAGLDDRDLLSRHELMSYARFSALSVAAPNSVERAVWGMLRAAEIDLIRLILALNAPPDPKMPRPRTITIDGRRFSYEFQDDDRDPRDARLVFVDAPAGAAQDEAGDVLAN